MEKLIERLLGRPFMAPGDEGSGGNGGADGVGAQGAGGPGGAGSDAGAGADGGANGGDKGGSRFADIAARASGAFARKSGGASDGNNGAGGANDGAGDDGVDPKTRPATGWPEWLPEKFHQKGPVSESSLLEALKAASNAYTTLEPAYTALKNQKGMGKVGDKPEDYIKELKVPEGANLDHIRKIDIATDPAVGVFRKLAHKHKIPVDVASGLMMEFLTDINPLLPVPQSEEDIVKELGEGGAALRDTLGTWLEGQFNNKSFSEEELEWAFNSFGGSATGIRVLAKVREMTGEKPIPLDPGRVAEGLPSIEEWYAMNRDDRMKTDVAFRNKVEAYGEKLFGDEPAGSSEAGLGVPPQRKVERRERASTRA